MATSDLYLVLTYYDPFEFGFTTLNQKTVWRILLRYLGDVSLIVESKSSDGHADSK